MRYKGIITCVCLMGEGQNLSELEAALRIIRKHGLKTCLYSGCNSVEPFQELLPLLDYLKLGAYDAQVGGLDSPSTNQRFYSVEHGTLFDQTHMFQRRYEE